MTNATTSKGWDNCPPNPETNDSQMTPPTGPNRRALRWFCNQEVSTGQYRVDAEGRMKCGYELADGSCVVHGMSGGGTAMNPPTGPTVWVVQRCDYEDQDVLGVFATEADARAFEPSECHTVEQYRIGWRYDEDDK